jgi:hypothetical protein
MAVSREEMHEDLGKVLMRRNLYYWGGLGMLVLGAVLVIMFFTREEWPALALAAVAVFWGAVLLYHARRTRELARVIESRLEREHGSSGEIPASGTDRSAPTAEGRDRRERGS